MYKFIAKFCKTLVYYYKLILMYLFKNSKYFNLNATFWRLFHCNSYSFSTPFISPLPTKATIALMNIHTSQINNELISDIASISLSMFRKNFFGIFHGAISARVSKNRFLINKQHAIFDNLNADSMIMLYHKQDYRWNEASLHAPIHAAIYKDFSEAKFIAYAMPPYLVSYTLKYSILKPKDYFGYKFLAPSIEVFDPKDYETWADRADTDIPRYFKEHSHCFMLIKGYGAYVYARDLYTLAKIIALIENSCKVAHYNADLGEIFQASPKYDI